MNRKALGTLLLIPALLASSCGGAASTDTTPPDTSAPAPAETTAAETTPEQYIAALPDADYGGYEFRMIEKEDVWTLSGIWAESENGDILNDAVYRRNRAVEERYNIHFKHIEQSDVMSSISNSVRAGEDAYDLALCYVKEALNTATEGVFLNLRTVKNIDLDHPWWDQSGAELLTIDNKLYAAFSDTSIHDLEYLMCIVFNSKMLADYKLDDPYELTLDGKWTMDRFHTMSRTVSRDLDGDSKMGEKDQYGFISGLGCFNSWLTAADESYFDIGTDGSIRLRCADETVIKKMELICDCINNTDNAVYLNDNAWGEEVFTSGRALFYAGCLFNMSAYRGLDLHFGIVPLPKYDDAQENYYTLMSNCSLCSCIPVTASDPARSGMITEALGAYSYQTLRHSYYDIMLKDKLSRDDYTVEMLDIITESKTSNLAVFYEKALGSIITGYLNSAHANGASQLVSYTESVKSAFEAAMGKIVEAYRKAAD